MNIRDAADLAKFALVPISDIDRLQEFLGRWYLCTDLIFLPGEFGAPKKVSKIPETWGVIAAVIRDSAISFENLAGCIYLGEATLAANHRITRRRPRITDLWLQIRAWGEMANEGLKFNSGKRVNK